MKINPPSINKLSVTTSIQRVEVAMSSFNLFTMLFKKNRFEGRESSLKFFYRLKQF